MIDIFSLKVEEIASKIKDAQLTSVEVCEKYIERINKFEKDVKAWVHFDKKLLLEKAAEADEYRRSGRPTGPLHGIPIAIKDLCDTSGIRTMGGSYVFRDNIPKTDATVVVNLRKSGAISLGKLNMTEGAVGGYNPKFAIPENPWRKSHWSGASSSGSGAATAAGIAYGTLGSDTGGSIRHPAAVCGVVGLKPTWGLVSRYGIMDLAPSLDHVGPLARSSVDAGIMLQAISGQDPNDPTTLTGDVPEMLAGIGQGISQLRIGWDEDYSSTDMETITVLMSHSQFRSETLILRHAWLNL